MQTQPEPDDVHTLATLWAISDDNRSWIESETTELLSDEDVDLALDAASFFRLCPEADDQGRIERLLSCDLLREVEHQHEGLWCRCRQCCLLSSCGKLERSTDAERQVKKRLGLEKRGITGTSRRVLELPMPLAIHRAIHRKRSVLVECEVHRGAGKEISRHGGLPFGQLLPSKHRLEVRAPRALEGGSRGGDFVESLRYRPFPRGEHGVQRDGSKGGSLTEQIARNTGTNNPMNPSPENARPGGRFGAVKLGQRIVDESNEERQNPTTITPMTPTTGRGTP